MASWECWDASLPGEKAGFSPGEFIPSFPPGPD